MSQDQFVKQTKETHKAAILAKPNVVGVGVGEKTIRGQKTGETCVVVMVRQKIPQAGLTPEMLVPQEVSGVQTDIIEVGRRKVLYFV